MDAGRETSAAIQTHVHLHRHHLPPGLRHQEPGSLAGQAAARRTLPLYLGRLEGTKLPSLRIGGIEDHIHILSSLHPTVALANLVKEIKTASSAWIKGRKVFPAFDHWQEGYGAFTVAADARPGLIAYIRGQEAHHQREEFVDELKRMVEAVHLEWQPDYLP